MQDDLNAKVRLFSDDFNEATYVFSGDELRRVDACVQIVTDVPNQFLKAHDTDAAYDIVATENCWVPPNGKHVVSTGLKMAIPKGYVGIIKSRSGLSVKHDIEVGAGVIDSGYRGEVKVVLRNLGKHGSYEVHPGDKVAQMVIVKLPELLINRVDSLDDSDRGAKGFNSTGYKA